MKLRVTIIFLFLKLSLFAQIDIERVVNIGKNSIFFEDYVLAIQYFNQAITAKPFLAEPYYQRGVAKFMLDDFKGAEADATLCIEKNPYYGVAYQLRGSSFQNQGNYKQAMLDYKKSLEFYPEDKITLINMGIVNIELKDYDNAFHFIEVLNRRFPDYIPGYLVKAQISLEKKDTLNAYKNYDEAISKNKFSPQTYSMRGTLYFRQQKYKEALADFNKSISLDPNSENTIINRGIVKYNLNDFYGALDDYNRVLETNKNNLLALFNRGILRSQVADNNKAIDDFSKVINIDPYNYIAYLNRAILLYNIKDYNSSIKDINVVLKEYPRFYNGYLLRSNLKHEINDLKGSEKDYLTAKKIYKEAGTKASPIKDIKSNTSKNKQEPKETRSDKDKNINRFNLLVFSDDITTGKYDRYSRGRVQDVNAPVDFQPNFVLTYYEKILEIQRPVYFLKDISPIIRKLYLNYVLKFVCNEAPLTQDQIKNHFKSVEEYTNKISRQKNSYNIYIARAIDYFLIKDYDNALSDISKSISLSSDSTISCFLEAIVKTKKIEESNQNTNDFTTTKSILNNNLNNNQKDNILPKDAKYEAIIEDYDKILNIHPKLIFAIYNRARINYILNHFDKAIEDYTNAIKIEPQFAEAYYNRALVYLSTGKLNEGMADLRKAGELGIIESYSILKRMK